MKQSKFLSINFRDLFHVFIVSAIAFLLDFAQQTLIPSLNISPELRGFLFMSATYLGKKLVDKPTENNF